MIFVTVTLRVSNDIIHVLTMVKLLDKQGVKKVA
ncbi:hypothetical protein STSP2_01781 [Anaerohalosphaera lusitana]|uniref:Uncharacterized protein n=1 Tax=Anaerohalosphaera lusitana TaxID=1936003 RepID=A0A1U9NL00_9BACT|nr:hypothetical protein STSP2_01781 [Anaerohalosphaera lusitana]